jgi:hypothetical protein
MEEERRKTDRENEERLRDAEEKQQREIHEREAREEQARLQDRQAEEAETEEQVSWYPHPEVYDCNMKASEWIRPWRGEEKELYQRRMRATPEAWQVWTEGKTPPRWAQRYQGKFDVPDLMREFTGGATGIQYIQNLV